MSSRTICDLALLTGFPRSPLNCCCVILSFSVIEQSGMPDRWFIIYISPSDIASKTRPVLSTEQIRFS